MKSPKRLWRSLAREKEPTCPRRTLGQEPSTSDRQTPLKVVIAYPYIQHYRRGVFIQLNRDSRILLNVWAGNTSRPRNIAVADLRNEMRIKHLVTIWFGRSFFQPTLPWRIGRTNADRIILVGDVASVSTWLAAMVARLRGKQLYFWTIGWHRPETGIKRVIRVAFYRLANELLLYGSDGMAYGLQAGYPAHRMRLIGNSQDALALQDVEEHSGGSANSNGRYENRARMGVDHLVGAVVRPNRKKRMDLLIEAVSILRADGISVGVLIVGEGTENHNLSELANLRSVPAELVGPVHDPRQLSQIYREIDVTVVPEAIGLTAVQSLHAGTPVISCDDISRQMPEHEAIVAGVTGDYYKTGDVSDLTRTILHWLGRVHVEGAHVAEACKYEAKKNWTPEAHANRIIEALEFGGTIRP